jgi:hypothetical protein
MEEKELIILTENECIGYEEVYAEAYICLCTQMVFKGDKYCSDCGHPLIFPAKP